MNDTSGDPTGGEANLPSTGERFIPGLGGMIELEHLHRYMFARQACVGKAVLDIACGEGYGSSMLGQVAQAVIGVDIAPEAVAHARKRYSTGQVAFRVGDCAAIPVEDASIDVVVSFETIEHHDQHEMMMREIRRVLKSDGLLILSSPERYEYSERPGTNNAFHVRELYRDELTELVGRFFSTVQLYDQKVLFGSAILAEEQATRSWSVHADALHERARGLARPQFLIAVASDGPVPTLDTGVFEQDLVQTSEWKWWTATLADRDARIRQLAAQAEQQAAQLANRIEAESQLANVTAMVHAVGADRDEAQRRYQASLSEILELQRQLLAERDASVARTTTLENDLSEAKGQLATITTMVHTVGADRDEAQRRYQASLSEVVDLQRQLLAERDASVVRTTALEDALSEAKGQLATLTAMIQAVGADRDAALRQYHASVAEVVDSQRQLLDERKTAVETGRRMAADLETLESRLSSERHTAMQRARDLAALRAEADALSARAAAAEVWGSTLAADIGSMRGYVEKLEWVLSTTRHAVEVAATRAAAHERLLATEQARLQALWNSTSWRVTRPLRATKQMLLALASAPRRAASHGVRAGRTIYQRLPIDPARKSVAKDKVFGAFRFALRDTRLYHDWAEFNDAQRARLADDRHGPAVPDNQAPVTADPMHPAPIFDDGASTSATIPQLAEEVTVMTEPPTTEPTYSAGSKPLWVADGRREWEDLDVMREKIEIARLAHMRAVVPHNIDLISVGVDDVASVARSLSFARYDKPRVSILLPVYNQIAMTLECLASIARAQGNTSFEVIIADDASEDETAAVLASVDGLVIHTNAENLHFLRNCNAALPLARGDYVVFLNNDVQVQDWWLDELVSAFECHDRVGAVGPKIVYPSGHLQEAGVAFNVDMTVDMVGLHDDPQLPRYNYVRRVDYTSGACLMVPQPLLLELGGFSKDFVPAYCEDGDLCLRIRDLGFFVYYVPNATVVHRLSATTAADNVDAKRRLVADNLVTFAGKWQQRVEEEADVRTIAFYLPQFYPFPENDQWWGKGFTEWTNVTKAQPNFVGHYQPHLPADLGFYDLRVAKTMEDQAELARRYGLGGFCFYYYWFAGKRLLDLPVERMLESGRPDFPFCLCWANENWTRRWDGQESHVLMAQSHSAADDEAVIRDLMRYFESRNYIRIDGRPLLVIYRVTLFPNFAKTAARWRALCRAEGVGEIYLSMVESFELVGTAFHPSQYGCDATIEFPPQGLAEVVPPSGALLNPDFVGHCVDYRTLALRYCTRPAPAYTRFRGAMPGWDNTARRQDTSYCVEHASPGGFQAWLEHIIEDARKQHFGDERVVFINAWNEWAEGAHLEPDRRFGHTYLEALKNAKERRALIRSQRNVL